MSTLAILPTSEGWAGGALDYGDPAGGGSVPFPIGEIYPEEMHVTPLRAQVATMSPTTFRAQVQNRGGAVYRLSLRIGDMGPALAARIVPLIQMLASGRNLMSLDIDPWCPGVTPLPGTRLFRVIEGQPGWQSHGGVVFGAHIEAIETLESGVASDLITAALPWWEGGALGYSLPTQENVSPNQSGWEGANDSAA
jgi:hypothetical protein